LESKLSIIEIRLDSIEKRVGKIPDPFVLFYKSPESDKHQNITNVLDNIHIRIGLLEKML
jgi:hypothetical protein